VSYADQQSDRQPASLEVMISAGEASGEKHGAALARALGRLYPSTRFTFFGAGGDEMRAAGVDTLVDINQIATIGVAEIARALPRFYRAYRAMVDATLKRRPSIVVLIDWPDFNMRLARALHRRGLQTIYYISPQVWAWRKYRVNALRRDVDRMLVILPFERDFYEQLGVPVEYVGHPLVDSVNASATRAEFCRQYDMDPRRPIISLLPGSRHSEVQHHLPVMLEAAARLRQTGFSPAPLKARGGRSLSELSEAQASESTRGCPQFVVPLASTIPRQLVQPSVEAAIDAAIEHANSGGRLEVTVVERDTYNALFSSQLAVVASGTATVEAALAGLPMVIVYRASALNWRLLRPLIHLDTFGMVNLIAGRKIVPELIQHEVTAERISAEVTSILSDERRLAEMREGLRSVRNLLSTGGAPGAEQAARAVMRAAVEHPRRDAGVVDTSLGAI
jgi:lipid-A-disaccharide synthase